ncbi:MAG: polysaccharide pyruvyl transferase family protein [Desulfobacteraceae bacterium]|jgi:polysaccharide pyruvyl transferase WcaK-like protein
MNDLNVGLLTADLNSGNMGCNALCYSAIMLIKDAAKQLGVTIKFTIFEDIPEESLSKYPNLANTQIKIVSPALTFKSKIKKILRKQATAIKNFDRSFDSCDLLFEVAGGDSFSDIYGIDRPQVCGKYHARAAKKKIPLVFLPQTIGPFKSDQAKEIASKSLVYANHIFARDPISFNKVKEYTTSEKVTQTVDMACFMDYEPFTKSADKPRIGINPSGLLWNGGYTGDNQFGLKMSYKELIYSIIEFIDKSKYEIVLVPHVLHGPDYHIEDDYSVCKYIQKKFPFCEIAPFFYSPVEAKSYISGLNLLIGSRMHCCIAAYSTGVPIYPLAYSRKFRGLFKDELDYPYGAELVTDDVDSALDGLKNVLDNMAVIQATMSDRLEKLTSYRHTLVNELKNVISRAVK